MEHGGYMFWDILKAFAFIAIVLMSMNPKLLEIVLILFIFVVLVGLPILCPIVLFVIYKKRAR